MKLAYQLTEEDFVTYQLYTSSKSKLHKKRRTRSRFLIPILYMIYAGYTYSRDQNMIGLILFGFISLVWILLYPLYSKWRYKKHFQSHVKDTYKNRVNKTVELEFSPDFINTKDLSSFSKIDIAELDRLIEIEDYFFLKMNNDLSLVIPKHAVDDKQMLKQTLLGYGIDYIDELNWRWK